MGEFSYLISYADFKIEYEEFSRSKLKGFKIEYKEFSQSKHLLVRVLYLVVTIHD